MRTCGNGGMRAGVHSAHDLQHVDKQINFQNTSCSLYMHMQMCININMYIYIYVYVYREIYVYIDIYV